MIVCDAIFIPMTVKNFKFVDKLEVALHRKRAKSVCLNIFPNYQKQFKLAGHMLNWQLLF